MLKVFAKAAPLKPEIRLRQAVSEFEDDLSAKQKVEFQALKSQSSQAAPNQNDVMWLTAKMNQCISNKSGSGSLGPRFTNFVQGVQQFAALGDIIIGGSQNLIACGVWSVVRISLLSFVNLSAYIDKLSSLFMAIGRTTPRYQEMALLYPHSKALQSSLAEYFIIVVKLCHYIFNFGQKSSVRQFSSSLSDAQLKTFQSDLDGWANSIKEEMLLAEAKENSRFRALARGAFTPGFHQQGYASKIQVLDLCSNYDHTTTWKQTRKIGNSSHQQLVEYQEWKNSSNSCTLVYTGKLGSGKSVLMANIVDDLNLCIETDRSLVVYFFCKHDIRESLEARTILGSLVRQLLCTVPNLDVLAKRYKNTHFKGDTEDLIQLLVEAFPKDRKIYIVLDGIDECDFEQREILAKALREIQEKLQVLLCISFREEPDNGMQATNSQLLATRIVSLPENNPDIEAFIETELERCLQRGLLTIGDPTLILEIQDTLLKGSQGMFLWVALQIKTLCSKKTDHAIREALADLPKDLSGTFERILKKSGTDLSLQTKTLQLVLSASRPLTTDELREALSVVPGDATWDPSKLLHNVYSALACCGCLLAVDEEEYTVRVVHHSIKQYLLTEHCTTEHAKFSIKDAQRTMADIIVTYLCYGVFGTELSRVNAHPVMAQPLLSKIVQSTTGSSSNSSSLAIKLLKLRKQSDFDLTKAITEIKGSSPSENEKGTSFSFYQYANTHWYEHILSVSGHDAAVFRLASKSIDIQASTFKTGRRDTWAVFERAFENGNEDILCLLLAAKIIDADLKDESGQPIIIRAALQRRTKLVETLLRVDQSNLYRHHDNNGHTALMLAAISGYEDVVEVILMTGYSFSPSIKYHARGALFESARLGHKKVVEIILKNAKLDINATDATDDEGRTVLIYAAAVGHKDVVEAILESGKFNINATDMEQRTALIHATSGGHKDVVEVILQIEEVDVTTKDRSGNSALMVAISQRHKDIVEMLLRTGKCGIENSAESGKRAMTIALLSEDKDIIKLLTSYGASAY